MSMHQFDTEIAKDYGIEAAIILQNLSFWIEKNKANNVHSHDGTYWTYNSIKAFNELFPYMSESSIRRTLKSLEEKGIIKTGNYNKVGYDRTTWYAITEKGSCILNKSILSKYQMEMVKTSNGISQSGEPIPDGKQDTKQNIKPVSKDYEEIEKAYAEAFETVLPGKEPIIDYKAVRSRIKALLKTMGKEKILQAIQSAKHDAWLRDNGFSLLAILGNFQLNKLINGSGYNNSPTSAPKPSPVKKCPKCGSPMTGLSCKHCFTNFDSEGNEV